MTSKNASEGLKPSRVEEHVEEAIEDDDKSKATGVYTTLSVLLLGVFISQTDQSFVLATYPAVSSEFNDFGSGTWLISAYILAQCVAQPLYGKMADVYGRKACLQASYILFTIGTLGSGLGQSMGQVIAGRAIQGAGGAGMVSMVSIVVTDLVPLREVATLWSYVNILQTTGRSCGGFIGGLLTKTLGWRW
jgi:MFS family permease